MHIKPEDNIFYYCCLLCSAVDDLEKAMDQHPTLKSCNLRTYPVLRELFDYKEKTMQAIGIISKDE
jgi:hypothetical protein